MGNIIIYLIMGKRYISIGKIDLNLFRYPPQYINKVFFGKYLEFPNGVYNCPYPKYQYHLR